MRRIVRVLLLVASLAVVVTTSGLTFSYETAQYAAEVGDAATAEIKLDLGAQATIIRAAPDPETLFQGELDYVGEIQFEVAEGRQTHVQLKADSHNKVYAGVATLEWSVDLNPAVPLSLIVDGSAGDLDADLSELPLAHLDVELDSGDTWIRLPYSDRRLTMRLATGSGDVVLTIPSGLALAFSPLQIGRGEVLFEIGQDVDFEASVELNAGRLVLDVPDDAAVRITVESAERGNFTHETPLSKVRSGWTRDTGVWQTAVYRDEGPHIDLSVRLNRGELIVR